MARLSPGLAVAAPQVDTGKYVRYTPEQVEALERVYNECPKPTSLRRQQIIRDCPILSNIEPKQIKVWFQNRRFAPLSHPSPLVSPIWSGLVFAGNVGGSSHLSRCLLGDCYIYVHILGEFSSELDFGNAMGFL
jgi:hypothetical protein